MNSEDWNPIDKWTPRYRSHIGRDFVNDTAAPLYGSLHSYLLAALFLKDCKEVEDWGCGFGTFSGFCLSPTYIGLDGSDSPAAHAVVDLRKYTSAVEGILLRHVLEHNPTGWRQILANALGSFSKKMVLVIYTPFGDVTRNVRKRNPPDVRVPVALSFRENDIVSCIPQEISWSTQVGAPLAEYETMFYLQKGDDRPGDLLTKEVAYYPNFNGEL